MRITYRVVSDMTDRIAEVTLRAGGTQLRAAEESPRQRTIRHNHEALDEYLEWAGMFVTGQTSLDTIDELAGGLRPSMCPSCESEMEFRAGVLGTPYWKCWACGEQETFAKDQ